MAEQGQFHGGRRQAERPVSGAGALTLTLGDGVAVGSDVVGVEVGDSPGELAGPDVAPGVAPGVRLASRRLAPGVAPPVLGLVAEAAPDGDGPDSCRARAARVPLADGSPSSGMSPAVPAPVAVTATPAVRAVANGPDGPRPAVTVWAACGTTASTTTVAVAAATVPPAALAASAPSARARDASSAAASENH